MDTKRRIFVDSPGQTCNRFWAYLDSIAWAIAKKKKVIIWHWDSSICCYDALRECKCVSFPFYSKFFISIFGERKWRILLYKLLNNRFLRRFYRTNLANRIGLISSWPLRKSFDYFPQMKEQLIPLFRPNEELCIAVDKTMRKYKMGGAFVIGVHIRRGDYKTWEGGRYYYEHQEYAEMMHSLVREYRDKKVFFFISTNEVYDKDVFKDLNLCEFDNITAAQDLYTLSLCDRIIGPLSTFSRWASWYGNVPLVFFERGKNCIKDSDFSIIHDFYHFENGNEIINLSDKN